MTYPVAFSEADYGRAALPRILSVWQASEGRERDQARDLARVIIDQIRTEVGHAR